MIERLKYFTKKRTMNKNVCRVCGHDNAKHLYLYPNNVCTEKCTNGETCQCHVQPKSDEDIVNNIEDVFGTLFKQAKTYDKKP